MENTAYKSIKIMEHFWSIENGFVRCFLLEGAERAMLVDTGLGDGDLRGFCSSLTAKPIFVVTTHSDGDHTGSHSQFDEIYMHPSEFDRYLNRKKIARTDIRPLWEGDIIDLGGFKLEIILLPGHTPGSIALLERERRFLIAGDSVQTDAIFMFAEGRSLSAFLLSMEKLMKMKSDFDIIYSSHGELSLTTDFISELIACGEKILAGEVEGETIEMPFPTEAKLYRLGRAKFLY